MVRTPDAAQANEQPVPFLDDVAATRWRHQARAESPWLHEEVARRMESRLDWITLKPQRWVSWSPVLSGLQAHRRIAERYAGADVELMGEQIDEAAHALRTGLVSGLWTRVRQWAAPKPASATSQADMLWANMALHLHSRPVSLLSQWHATLKVGGFVMFSCLGPDTARELQTVYARHGWGPPLHPLTDMHDWGDMLVESGFADPVMDMERLTLTYTSAQALLSDCRAWGRNLHLQRHAALRGRAFRQRLIDTIEQEWPRTPDGHLSVTVEVIYGHAVKPTPRLAVSAESAVSLNDMRQMLRTGRPQQG